MFKIFKKKSSEMSLNPWVRQLGPEGVVLTQSSAGEQLHHDLIPEVIEQLLDSGFGQWVENSYCLAWDEIYALTNNAELSEFYAVFELPATTKLHPSLFSIGSLTDEDFQVVVGNWIDINGATAEAAVDGALISFQGKNECLTGAQWELIKAVKLFARRDQSERGDLKQRLAWGKIRKLALLANANLDAFLYGTVVLTPEKLEIGLRKSQEISDDSVIEVIPSFENAPAAWIERFDQSTQVLDRYDIVTDDGIIQVLIEPKVKTVLGEIKRMPGRLVAGSRAQAFLMNPFATLGDDAADVISEEKFVDACESAGIRFERFFPHIKHDSQLFEIGLRIEAPTSNGDPISNLELLTNQELEKFLTTAKDAIKKNFQLIFWKGYELEVNQDTVLHLENLEVAMLQRLNPQPLVSYEDVHDLSRYSNRILDIGVEKPILSPYIAKLKKEDGWFPENLIQFVTYTPEGAEEESSVPVTRDSIDVIKVEIDKAERSGKQNIRISGIDCEIPVKDAKRIVETFSDVWDDIDKGTFKGDEELKPKTSRQKQEKKTLLMHSNIDSVGYREVRTLALTSNLQEAEIPKSKSELVSLLPHQVDGVARLQHLFRLQGEHNVRGALLADDMGLGKTFQLLTLMAWILEKNPLSAPMLIVAPVSLLENWKEEADKFYPGAFKILTAYGDALKPLRLSREEIDTRLKSEDGLVKFLRPGWVGSANVVLTTYETLRDLEFSFANVYWSLMVCDEAQKIKNPAAMVTRAAWRQNVGFRISCTGTPVENTLVDLWSLFEFCQPGLLGALNDFGKLYRRPIEIDERDEEGKQRLDELRSLIEPQMLRRTKQDVARDLPKKIIVDECRHLKISFAQRSFYAKALDDFKRRDEPGFPAPFKNHLGLLQYIRIVCTDPRRYGLSVFKPEPLENYRKSSPKLDWLLKQLSVIKDKNEKVIIFCEFRNVQCLLQHYIKEVFEIQADIINGDTSASSTHSASRQKRIRAFQEKVGFNVIILSPVAVGFGVNIQAANHVIHYMRTWNPAKEDQATDRSYRIGQTKDVYVYYPVICGGDFVTFDERLDQLLDAKRSLAGDVLNGAADISFADFPIDQVVPHAYKNQIDDKVSIDMALQMDWRLFEGLAAALWKQQGFNTVYCTPPSGDNGVDVVAIAGDKGVLIQTKTSSIDGYKHGWDTVKELIAGRAFYEAKHPGVNFKLVGLTNQFFNTHAAQNAQLNKVILIDQSELEMLLSNYPIQLLEVEKFVWM
jgi:SNF2 family DNA or RNA helicase/Holliday junction resolvase